MSVSLARHVNFTPPALREVSILVNEVQGINLGQGVCLLSPPQQIIDAAQNVVQTGKNTYCAAQGIEGLRHALAHKLQSFNSCSYQHDNVIVTHGSTGAFENICNAFLEAGDEVITFRPCYPYHTNTLDRKQAKTCYVDLEGPDWSFTASDLENAYSPKTKFILITTPNNPTGKVFSREELECIADFCKSHDILCVTDEVYEYMTYDGHKHISMASLPGMFERTLTMGSYSKTFAITGWRIGYAAAPEQYVSPLRAMNDSVYVCPPTPFQYAVEKGIRDIPESYYINMLNDYVRKRSLLIDGIRSAGLEAFTPQGAYYIFADTRKRFPGKSSEEIVKDMISQVGVGAVPASDFVGFEVRGNPEKSYFLRFCFSVADEKLKEASKRLAKW